MKKLHLLIGVVVALVIGVGGFVFYDYLVACNVHHVAINDVDIGKVSTKKIDDYIDFVITDEVRCFDNVDLDTFACTYTFASNNDLSKRVSFGTYMKSLFGRQNFTIEILKSVSPENVELWVNEYNATAVYPNNARIESDDTHFYIVEDKDSTAIDYTKMLIDISPYKYKKLTLNDYLYEPTISGKDLIDLCNQANAYAVWQLTYTNGAVVKSDMSKVFIEDGRVIYDDSFIAEQLPEFLSSYNAERGTLTEFTDFNGEVHSIPYETWTTSVNIEAEVAEVKQCMKQLDMQKDRKPIMTSECGEIPSRYVEVDISDQVLYVINNGEVIMSSDCVTGHEGVHDTPVGVFRVSEMMKGKTLTGVGYSSYVSRWIRLNERGIGLHDANWRSSFGGTIYKKDGSHGCINLPSAFAGELFKYLEIGDCVVIHP